MERLLNLIGAALFGYMARMGLLLCAVPTAEDFARGRVTNPNQSEVIRGRLYDYQLYATAGTAQLTFYNAPIGQGLTSAVGGTAGQPKTFWDTNMQLGGQLPSGIQFVAESIEILFFPGSVATANTYTLQALHTFIAAVVAATGAAPNDVNSFYQSGLVELNILQKNYVRETPTMAFPPKANLDLSAAVATNSATTAAIVQTLAKAAGRPYYLEPTITLQPAMNFEVALKYPAAVATPSGFNARVGVVLDGYLQRASQ